MAVKPVSAIGVIMAGGSGQRFWPLSRSHRPKQCLALLGSGTMLQQACKRLAAVVKQKNILIITHAGIEKKIRAQAKGLPSGNIVLEPCGRDTAACIALAACLAYRKSPDAVLVIIPADHVIGNTKEWVSALRDAVGVALAQDVWVMLGIPPQEPATCYGYVQAGDNFMSQGGRAFHRVRKFHEKPDLDTAGRFLQSGGFWWNSGMFIAKARFILEQMRKYLPEHGKMCDALIAARNAREWDKKLRALYPLLPKISLDYGVLEKTDKAVVAQVSCDWDDLGSWPALARHLPADADGNVLIGPTAMVEGRGNIVRTEPDHFVGLIGVQDSIVVHTPDATLICPKNRSQDLKKLIEKMRGRYAARGLI